MRFFAANDDIRYEQARLALDQEWGHVHPTTCITPAAIAPRDSQNRIVLGVNNEFCEYPAAAAMLEFMLGTGEATEITEAEYRAAVQQEPA